VPHKYFTVDGVATYVHHGGPTTLPGQSPKLDAGETVVCLHRGGGNGAVFDDLRDALEGRHSALAFDQPGHARSGELDSLGDIGRMAHFTGQLTDALELGPHVLLGHSMGGAVALQRALDAPEAVRALVLCGSAARFDIPDDVVAASQRITEGKARRQFDRQVYSSATAPDVMQRGFMLDIKTDPRAGHGDLLATRAFDVEARLAEIRLPTLVVRGEDEVAPLVEASATLAKQIAGAREVVIPKAGHMLPLEQPQALADAVASFLEELSP